MKHRNKKADRALLRAALFATASFPVPSLKLNQAPLQLPRRLTRQQGAGSAVASMADGAGKQHD